MLQAEVHLLKSEYTAARSIHTHLLQTTDQYADSNMNAWTLLNVAEIDVIIGATPESVEQNLTKAKEIFSTSKHLLGFTCCEIVWADLKLREGDTLSAKTLFQQSLNSTWGRDSEVMSFTLGRLADRSRWQATEGISPWPAIYLAYAQQSTEKLTLHRALLYLGEASISQGDDNTALSLFTVALEGFVCMDVHRSSAQCLLHLGDLANSKGDICHAAELWLAARPLFERSSQPIDVTKISERLTTLEHLHPQVTISTKLMIKVEKSEN
jgi:hypothetical protein